MAIDFSAHPMPSCFFAGVAVICVQRGYFDNFHKYWWGHGVFDEGPMIYGGRAFPFNLAAAPSTADTFDSIAESAVYHGMRAHYPLRISAQPVDTVAGYLDLVRSGLARDQLVLMPYPRCNVLGLRGMLRPARHIVVAGRDQHSGVRLHDQTDQASVSWKQVEDGLRWMQDAVGTLLWYEIELESDWQPGRKSSIDENLQEALRQYRSYGRRALAGSLDWLATMDQDELKHGFPQSKLWTFVLARDAEIRHMRAVGSDRCSELIRLLLEMVKLWRGVNIKLAADFRLGAARFSGSIGSDLAAALDLEDRYFFEVQKVIRHD